MSSKVNRRQFLGAAGTGIAVGVTASAGVSALADDDPPAIPLPDSGTVGPADTTEPPSVCCTPAATLVFACSGSADVGEIADHAGRKLNADGVGKMSCLAGIGGRVSSLMEIARGAEVILAIDGCPLQCARNTLETAGFTKIEHVCLSDLGMEKGKTPVTDDMVARVMRAGKTKLGATVTGNAK
ncbi:MAG: putative zinc-binding protein [Pirellulaceae bacterium]